MLICKGGLRSPLLILTVSYAGMTDYNRERIGSKMIGATMKILLLVTLMVAFTTMSFAVTLNVAIDGSEQYISIQAAIEAASNGDTVLVHPGRYIENIDYIGKSITVCSLEATTNDSTYISQTIIDGNRNGSCVAFRNAEQNATLRGFTITNGTGFLTYDELTRGGGVLINNAYMTEGSVSLTNCVITGNHAGMGAGISCLNASLQLSGVNIHHNYSLASGGGILFTGTNTMIPSIVFDPVNRCSVYENYGAAPVDIAVFDIPANLTIHLNKATISPPSTFYIGRHNNLSSLQQYHDTAVVQQAHRTEINRDFYVSPNGDDNNSGISPDEPMRTITRAMHLIASDSLEVKTIHLLPGVYEEAEGQIYPIPIKSYTNLVGAGSDLVTLTSSVVCTLGYPRFINAIKARHNTICGFTITESVPSNRRPYTNPSTQDNLYLNDVVISDIQACEYSAFMISVPRNVEINKLVIKNITTPHIVVDFNKVHDSKISNSTFTNIHSTYVTDDPFFRGSAVISFRVVDSFTFENNEVSNMSVYYDQPTFAISLWNPRTTEAVDIRVNNCLFDNIRTNDDRAALFGSNDYSNVEISNCTFYNNYGSVAAVGLIGNIRMRNNIFFNPVADHEIVMYPPISGQQDPCNLDIDYSYIRGGEEGIYNISNFNTLSYGEQNLSEGELFADTNAGNVEYLRLAPGSPCIDAGTPDISLLGLPPYDLAGNQRVWNGIIDMGAYEYGSQPWVSINDPELPAIDHLVLRQNYPNPFNPTTTIAYSLPEASKVRLDIYNVKGQLVKTLVNAEMPAGLHSVVWNGRDMNNKAVASGVYFYRVSSPKATHTKRMLLMK